jgi:hypothetical protein
MELGSIEVDADRYPRGGGSRWTVVTASGDAAPDLAAIVRVILIRGRRLSADNIFWGDFSCGCSARPDPRRVGARALIEHLQACAGFADAVDAFRSDPSRGEWKNSTLAFALKTGRALPDWSAHPPAPQADAIAPVLAAARRGITVAKAYGFTAFGIDVNDVPDTLAVPRAPMVGFATARGVRAVQFLGKPTTNLRAAVQRFMQSDSADVLQADAQRIGAIVVYGYEGRPVAERQPDLRQMVSELQERLARLEGRPVPVGIGAGDYDGLKF